MSAVPHKSLHNTRSGPDGCAKERVVAALRARTETRIPSKCCTERWSTRSTDRSSTQHCPRSRTHLEWSRGESTIPHRPDQPHRVGFPAPCREVWVVPMAPLPCPTQTLEEPRGAAIQEVAMPSRRAPKKKRQNKNTNTKSDPSNCVRAASG